MALVACCCAVTGAEPQKVPDKQHSPLAPLPTKASDDEVEVLNSPIRTNKISDLQKEPPALKFQTALESARKLHEGKELKRAESALIQLIEGRAPDEVKRAGTLELGMVMQEQRELTKAQRIYSEYVRQYEKDPSVPEVLLRQGYLYRQMGVPVLALAKFYGVISSCLNLQLDQLDYYQKLVLRAQAEIAETFFLDGKFAEASDYLNRLLRLETDDLERAAVQYKLLRCLSALDKNTEAIASSRLFLEKYPDHADAAEVRFLLANSLKKAGRNDEALKEIAELLKGKHANSKLDAKDWLYWQQRAGNEIANQLYREGDFVNALQVYQLLAELNKSPEWQIPVWYQIGLVFENLRQPQKASETYEKLIARERESAAKVPTAALKQIAEMAAWRKQCLVWETNAQVVNKELRAPEEKTGSL